MAALQVTEVTPKVTDVCGRGQNYKADDDLFRSASTWAISVFSSDTRSILCL